MSYEHVPSVPSSEPSPQSLPRENVVRGALVALVTVPVGVALWVVVWGFGFVASLVAFAVAVLALRLYLWGAGRMTRVGATVVLLVTVLTLLLAFFGGIVLDAAKALGEVSELGAWGAFRHEGFWPVFWEMLPDAAPDYTPAFLWALGFGALGSFTTLRGAFAATESAPQPHAELQVEPHIEPEVQPEVEPAAGLQVEPETPERP
jgi:hypothetical protein